MGTCYWRRQVFEYHPLFGWWHLPNMYARVPLGQTYHYVTTNAAGMRSDRDYPQTRPAGRKRVVFLGDSYTAGDGVSNNQRFTDLLERRFPNFDAMNFGLNGSGTDQQLLIYEHLASEFEADAYVFCICVENIARNLYDCFPSYDWREQLVAYRPKPYFRLMGSELELCNSPVPRERRAAENLGDWRCSFPYVPGDTDPYAIYKDPESIHWRTMKAILQRFITAGKGHTIFIVPMPMCNHYLGENGPTYMPRFKEIEDKPKGVHVIDLLPAMQTVPLKDRRGFRFPDDPHYTAAAHSLVADAIEYHFALHAPTLLD